MDNNLDKYVKTLQKFLSFPINSSYEILNYFSKLNNAIYSIDKTKNDNC